MCPPCKIILDNGLTAIAADLLATAIDAKSGLVAIEARELAIAARASNDAYAAVLQAKVLSVDYDDFRWDGCHKATAIMAWVSSIEEAPVETMLVSLREWRAEILRDMSNLVAGGRAVG